MAKFYLAPKDAKGRAVRVGRRVRVAGMPDFSGICDAKSRREVTAVFRHVRGRCMKVRSFSRYGFVDLHFKIRKGPLAGWHSIEIEPGLLLVQKLQ
jgi:hypothetical protein